MKELIITVLVVAAACVIVGLSGAKEVRVEADGAAFVFDDEDVEVEPTQERTGFIYVVYGVLEAAGGAAIVGAAVLEQQCAEGAGVLLFLDGPFVAGRTMYDRAGKEPQDRLADRLCAAGAAKASGERRA